VPAPLTGARRRVVDLLKRTDAATAPQLAETLGLSGAAVRQHLDGLSAAGLVERAASAPVGPGRPPMAWRLTDLAQDLFPDRHADLTVTLIDTIRSTLGDDALQKVISARTVAQDAEYRTVVPTVGPLGERVAALARQRTAEGYVAEAVDAGDGSFLLVEHHCPICEAAASCLDLCRSELSLFRSVLGPDTVVERTRHLMSGDQRCVYRISSAASTTG
jgi:predicted ArsR family transcriptional regulator